MQYWGADEKEEVDIEEEKGDRDEAGEVSTWGEDAAGITMFRCLPQLHGKMIKQQSIKTGNKSNQHSKENH